MNRRGFLSVAASTPLVVGPALVVAPALVEAGLRPSELALRQYYFFLCKEHAMLGDEMGVGMCDAHTVHGAPPVAAPIRDHVCAEPSSSRALRVLTAAGIWCGRRGSATPYAR